MREFWSSPLFLAFKTFIPPWSFAIQHSDFSSFLAVSTTDKPVNRYIHALPLKKLNVFALRGFIFRDIHKNQGRSLSNSGYRIQKKCGWKIYKIYKYTRARAPLARKCTNRIFESKNWHKYENGELDWKTNFVLMICWPSPIVLKYRLIK